MRKIMLLAAIVAALGMVSQATQARDRGFGFRHFSAHAGPKLDLRHHGLKFFSALPVARDVFEARAEQ